MNEVERLRALARAAVEAHEEERVRIARALHDGPAQALSALAMQLDWIADKEGDADLRARLKRLVAVAGETSGELGRIYHELRPAALDRLGLEAALRELCARATSPALAIEMRGAAPVPAPSPGAATTAFRTVEAALGFLLAHTRSRRASVALAGDGPGALRVEVEGDGALRDERAAAEDPRRIAIEERVSWAGGTVAIEAEAEGPTRIRATIPLAGGGGK